MSFSIREERTEYAQMIEDQLREIEFEIDIIRQTNSKRVVRASFEKIRNRCEFCLEEVV